MSDEIAALLKRKNKGEFRDLAALLTQIEQVGPRALKHKDLLEPKNRSLRIGITGPPGAGKSTLISRLISDFRARHMKVGVLAVDPSSPFTQGAILGDRIRYSESFTDPGVFIRSIGTRGSQGGLSGSAYLLLRAFDAWKFDIVLIETVGVGQTELDIMYAADYVVVTLTPEGGDSIQAMKAGLLEIADLFLVNKSDRPGSGAFAKELESSLDLDESKPGARVLLASASENRGITELTEILLSNEVKRLAENRHQDARRLKAEARAMLFIEEQRRIERRVESIRTVKEFKKLMMK